MRRAVDHGRMLVQADVNNRAKGNATLMVEGDWWECWSSVCVVRDVRREGAVIKE